MKEKLASKKVEVKTDNSLVLDDTKLKLWQLIWILNQRH